jgi:hypothetical protein
VSPDLDVETTSQADTARCVTCGAPVAGSYCAQCGERRAVERDLSLRGFLRDALETFTSLDTRGARSLRDLITRPGFLTAEYVAGRRRRYLSPLQLFLVTNLLFFVAAAFLPVITFDSPLDVHLYASSYQELARDLVRDRFAEADTVDFVSFKTQLKYGATQHAKSLVIIFVPYFALIVALLRMGRREPAGHHIAFAFHYLAFALLLFIAMGVLILFVRALSDGRLLSGDSPVIPVIGLIALFAYLVPAFRTAYRSGTGPALAQAVIVASLFLPAIPLYRLILFFTVFFTT